MTRTAGKGKALTSQPPTEAEWAFLLKQAEQGDTSAWQTLKGYLQQIPDWEREYRGPAVQTRQMILHVALGKNLVLRSAWERQTQALQAELAGPEASPLERILCERIATCWLDMQIVDNNYSARVQEGISLATGEYYQKMQDRAHKRYLSACLALARVRRLLAPIMQQVNIATPGSQQMNIAQATPSPLSPDQHADTAGSE